MKYILAFALTLFLYSPAHSDTALEQCVEEHQLCASKCLQMEGVGSQATCIAQCAGVEAQCVGGVGIKKSEPYIRRKAQELENLLEQFFEDIFPDLPEKQSPPAPPKSPTET